MADGPELPRIPAGQAALACRVGLGPVKRCEVRLVAPGVRVEVFGTGEGRTAEIDPRGRRVHAVTGESGPDVDVLRSGSPGGGGDGAVQAVRQDRGLVDEPGHRIGLAGRDRIV